MNLNIYLKTEIKLSLLIPITLIKKNGNTFDVFEEFLAESQDRYLDLRDEQKLYRDRGLQKIKEALNPRDYALMQARLRGRGIKI